MTWSNVASIVGIVAAVGAVWARFSQLEVRAEITERVLTNLTGEVREMNGHIQQLEIKLASRGITTQ